MAGKRLMRAGVALMFALAAACGGGDAEEGAAATVEVETHDFRFEPAEWTAAADTDVTATVTNAGESEHEWVIIRAGESLASEEEFTEELVEFEVEAVPPGETGDGTFNLPAGAYQIICALEGHFAAGMQGELTLQ